MGNQNKAEQTLQKIISKQTEEGSFSNAKTSITRSSGKNLIVETTSLVLLGMLRINPNQFTDNIKSSVDFLVKQMNGGYFGCTQATILAMRALIEFMSSQPKKGVDLNFKVDLNGQKSNLFVGSSDGGKLFSAT